MTGAARAQPTLFASFAAAAKVATTVTSVTVPSGVMVALTVLMVALCYKAEKKSIIKQVRDNLSIQDAFGSVASFLAVTQQEREQRLASAKGAAAEITFQCLRRWDGVGGLKARTGWTSLKLCDTAPCS